MSNKLTELQRWFAIEWSKNLDNPFLALANRVGEAKASEVYAEWINNEDIKNFRIGYQEIIDKEGIDPDLMVGEDDKSSFARELLSTFLDKDVDANIRIKYGELLAKVNNYIAKPEAVTNVQINHVPPVMRVPSIGTDDNWEKNLVAKQEKIMDQSAMPVDIKVIEDE